MHHYHYYYNGDYHCSHLYLDIAAPIPKTRPGNVQIQSKSNGISAQKIKIPDISDDGENIESEEPVQCSPKNAKNTCTVLSDWGLKWTRSRRRIWVIVILSPTENHELYLCGNVLFHN